jgi:hypothetical protein
MYHFGPLHAYRSLIGIHVHLHEFNTIAQLDGLGVKNEALYDQPTVLGIQFC